MIESRRMDRLCIAAVSLAVIVALALMVLTGTHARQEVPDKHKLGLSQDYADTLFDASCVHRINVIVPQVNWDYMVAHATEEQYVLCDVEIDGEMIEEIAIRPKGNSSLASIAGAGSDRFSFKLEFDHYRPGKTFRGLDKLALNNLGQDISCMKDFLTYQMMADMDVPGPLCAYALVQLNGQDFGLYLAVEGVEDSFAARNYGEDWTGNLYRPDVYAIEMVTLGAFKDVPQAELFQLDVNTLTPGDRLDAIGPIINIAFAGMADQARVSAGGYAGDEPDSYRVVFDTAVFDMKRDDAKRYISAVKTLCESDTPLEALDVDIMCRYFAVHNFVNNYDSYTGIFAHNYYICERDGKLSMVPWDYNLAFGAFSAESAYKCFARNSRYYEPMALGQSMNTERSFVNYPIDTPLVSAKLEERPIWQFLAADPEGLEAYHAAFRDFLQKWLQSGRYERMVRETQSMIHPYVEKGLTFYTATDFDVAVENMQGYGELRARSVEGQLDGSIPATLNGQREDYASLINTSGLDMSRTIDFGGLAFGITSEEVCAILEAVFDGKEVADIDALAADLQEDPKQIVALIGRVLSASKLVSGALMTAMQPPLALAVCVTVLLIALRHMKKARRGA